MILAVWGAKGGVGVTTLAVGLALAEAEERHQEVLLADLNFVAPAAAELLSVEDTRRRLDRVPLSADAEGMQETLRNNTVWDQRLPFRVLPGIGHVSSIQMFDDIQSRQILQLFSRMDETVIVDCGCGTLFALQKEALMQSDYVLVVAETNLTSYRMLWERACTSVFEQQSLLKKCGLIVNRAKGAVKPKDVATFMSLPLLGVLPEIKRLNDCINAGNPLAAYGKKERRELLRMLLVAKERAEHEARMLRGGTEGVKLFGYGADYAQREPVASDQEDFKRSQGAIGQGRG